MNSGRNDGIESLLDLTKLTEGERDELIKLGILSPQNEIQPYSVPKYYHEREPIQKHAVHVPHTLSEAYQYAPRPSSFSRALALQLGGYKVLLVSGTASVDENGKSVHFGDFKAQCWRTYRNITELLKAEELTWQDVVRTTCYLRDMPRDYKEFNEVRTAFYTWLGLDPLPASTGIQAHMCREDLLVEIEAIAVAKNQL
jgi:enamine deaminase RidA (YjgF/YER057c/UK114 family)